MQRGQRPTCRMWQMGRCTFSSIQCEFRHADLDFRAQPTLDEGFVPQPRLSEPRWDFGAHQVHRDRQPLQELVLPASSTSYLDVDHDQQNDSGERSEWDDEDYQSRGRPRRRAHHWDNRDASEDVALSAVDGRQPMSFVSQKDAFNTWRETQDAFDPDQDITVWEDQEHDVSDEAPMSEDDSEDEISRLAELEGAGGDKENNLPYIASIGMDMSEGRWRRAELNSTERTDAIGRESPAPSSPSPPRRLVNSTSENSPLMMSQSRDISQNGGAPNGNGVGPHPSFIKVANPYIFEQQIRSALAAIGVTEQKEDSIRLQGVHYIDNTRKALQLPVRTFNTAVVYYHKFRLVHADTEYMWADAAAAALFLACKVEDTLKKSRDVLCAAWNLKLPSSEHLSPDDPPSKTVVGLERLMLESASFDFRTRHPQELVIKLVKQLEGPMETLGRMSFNMSIDLYRTFAPLKQTSATMAIACIELTARLLNLTTDSDMDRVVGPNGINLGAWFTTRGAIMETLLDLLDIYTHHRHATIVGPNFTIDNYVAIRIVLNKEATASNLARYTHWYERPDGASNGATNNGSKHQAVSSAVPGSDQNSNSPAMNTTSMAGAQSRVGERGKEGTVRFMLSAERARGEKEIVAKYFAPDEYEEYEEEVDVSIDE
ncbi:cyclin [Aureobasidium subglaciale]|nr:cyclin [Aureobasidium subglaciale]